MYIDSHAHLTSEQLLPDIAQILLRAKAGGLDKIVNICTDTESLEKGLKLAQEYPWILNAAATTPHDVEKKRERHFFL